jgi:hypothetical protein
VVWGTAVDAFEAADRMRAGTVEGGLILRDECISRIIKFDSKQNKTIGVVVLLRGHLFLYGDVS